MSLIDFFRSLFEPEYYSYESDYSEYANWRRKESEKANSTPTPAPNPKSTVVVNMNENNFTPSGVNTQGIKSNEPQKSGSGPNVGEYGGSTKIPASSQVYGPMPLSEDLLDKGYHKDKGFKFVRKEKKDVVVFVIENSLYTQCYSKEIQSITKKILDSNNESLFMILKVGDDKLFFDILDYDLIAKSDVLSVMLQKGQPSVVDYAEVLEHILKFYTDTLLECEYNNKKYDIQNMSYIFMGSGKTYNDVETIKKVSKLVADVKSKKKTKTIKYFCMSDKQSIDVAKLGFPVIGHIDNDFYD